MTTNTIVLEDEEKQAAHAWLGVSGNEYVAIQGGPIITMVYLVANKHYNFVYADPTEINIQSLAEGPAGINNCYNFEFNTGSSYLPTLNLPEGVVSDLGSDIL